MIENAKTVETAATGVYAGNRWIAVWVIHLDGSYGWQITYDNGSHWMPVMSLPSVI